jgi:membrane-bound metal-dependent hydrolase YbcI (DUF457 family)
MPLTPLHLGPGLLLGSLTSKFLNLWALLLGSVVMDIEPLILILVKHCYHCPHHGFFHSILGAFVGSLILSFILWKFREILNKISLKFKISQSFSFKNLYFSSLIAWLIHVFFDSLVHYDVFPLWPSRFNPIFIGEELYWPLNLILLIFGIIGFIIFYKYYARHKIYPSES